MSKEGLDNSPWLTLIAFILATFLILTFISFLPQLDGRRLFSQEFLNEQLQGVAAITGSAVAILLAVIAIRTAKLGSMTQSPEYQSAYAAYLATSDFMLYFGLVNDYWERNEKLKKENKPCPDEYLPGALIDRFMEPVRKPEFGILVRRLDIIDAPRKNSLRGQVRKNQGAVPVGPLQIALGHLIALHPWESSDEERRDTEFIKNIVSSATALREKLSKSLNELQERSPEGSFDIHLKKMVIDMGVLYMKESK